MPVSAGRKKEKRNVLENVILNSAASGVCLSLAAYGRSSDKKKVELRIGQSIYDRHRAGHYFFAGIRGGI